MKRVAIALVLLLVAAIVPLSGGSFAAAAVTSENPYVIKAVNVTTSADAYSYIYKGEYYKWYSYHQYYDNYELAIGNSSYYQKERAYLRFNLSGIPKAAEIASAEVCVYVAYIRYFSTPMNVGIYNITNNWNENYTKPAPEPGTLLDNRTLSKGWVCFNVTDYVKSRFPEQSLFSFVLKLVNEDIYNYAWIYSRENAFDKPILKVSYYVPIAIKSISVSSPTYTNIPIYITTSVANGGNSDSNVTFVLKINEQVVLNESIVIPAGRYQNITYKWVPTQKGTYTITAEIMGDGFSDTSSTVVNVAYNPYLLFAGLAGFYANMFKKEAPAITSTYENFTATVEKLQSCGVDLGDLKDEIAMINSTYEQMMEEYNKFLEMTSSPLYQSGMVYSYPVTMHIRKAVFLGRTLISEINKVMPILQETLEKVEPLCHPAVNETNQTAGNVTAPSNGTVTNQTSNYTIHITKVLIDLSHGQYYFTKYGVKTLTSYIQDDLHWEVQLNYKPLTYDELEKYDVVILTNPKSDLTSDEISALREYVENGGALFVAGDWYKYLSDSLNELLAGTGVAFEKTELMDDEQNSGRSYYPYVGIYNRDCSITKFIPDDWKMYYNGDTLKITGDAKWVIRGYESAYAVDADGNTVYEKGSEPVVAAALTLGKGRIVVYGSSKALSDAYYDKYIKSNWPFIKGALLWLVGES